MTLEGLYEKLKSIYGENCLTWNYETGKKELLCDIFYQLDYSEDDFVSMISVSEANGEFFLTAFKSTCCFGEEGGFEVLPTIKNLVKKYGINADFTKKIESFESEYLQKTVSDFMCFFFSSWFFVLHQARYGYPVLSRGYYYREEYESQVEFKNEEFLDVIKKCKDTYSDFYFDEDERLFYRLVDGSKKYLVKLFDGFTFNSLVPDKEEVIMPRGEGIKNFTKEEIVEKIKEAAGDKFNEKELSYTTFIYENNVPIKLYLKREGNKYFFTDKGVTKQKYKKECSEDEFAALVDCFDLKNFEVREYLQERDLLAKDTLSKALEQKLNFMALKTVDVNEFDFSNIGKFATKINSYKNIREIILKCAQCEVYDEVDKCTFIAPFKYEDGKNVSITLEKGEVFSYYTFNNGYSGETLEKLLALLKDKDISFDKEENKFKILVYECDERCVLRKAHKMLEFIIFYTNINKFFSENSLEKCEEDIPSTYGEVCANLKKLENYGPFWGFYESWYGLSGASEKTNVVFVFGTYYIDSKIARSASVEIKKESNKYFVSNYRLEQVLLNGAGEQLLNLINNFDLSSRVVTNSNFKTKLSNMVQFVICAQLANLI